ncbi:hypothetical protein [Parafrankia sp. FMc2]|uniref:hypothetical protein n=1 Tax=Parafrankia sp. FMc2 TaxID=3233196 RepID=UPI0034D3B7AA
MTVTGSYDAYGYSGADNRPVQARHRHSPDARHTPDARPGTGPGPSAEDAGRPARSRWPLAGLAAAVLAPVGSFILGWDPDESITRDGTDAIYQAAGDHRVALWLGGSIGFVAVLLLLGFAAGLTRLLERRAPDSLAVPAAKLAFAAALGGLMFSFGLKHVLAGGVPGGIDNSFYTKTDVEVLAVVVSQMQYAAWWGVIAAAACVAVVSLRHRVLPTWFGIVSAVLAGISITATVAVGLPYSAGILAPVWLLAAGTVTLRLRGREI